MDWKTISENWGVIVSTMPLLLILAAGLIVTVWLFAKTFYGQEVKNATGLRDLAKEGERLAKEAIKELEKKVNEKTPPSDKPTPPPDVVPVINNNEVARVAFIELNSPEGLHLRVDPRSTNKFRLFVDQREIERMAAARYFLDRGLIGFYKPDAMGTGVTVTASSTATEAYSAVVPKIKDPPKHRGENR